MTTNNSGAKVQNFTYSYTAEGLLSKIKDTSVVGGTTVNQSQCFQYDIMHQLTRAWTRGDHNCANSSMGSAGPDPYLVSYDHNKIGGITRATGSGTVGGNYTYPAAGQARPHAPKTAGGHSYTYDAAGNRKTHTTGGQTTTYIYDVQNRLISIGGAGEGAGSKFLYDTSGNRVRRIVPGEATVWYLGGDYATASDGSNTVHISIAGETVGALVDGVVWTTATDHLRSASYSASTAGTRLQRYLPFGAARGTGAQPTDRGFTGQLNDRNGLYHFGARYYDPLLGQFTQPDSLVPDVSKSMLWNRYSYVANNPLRFIDPSGHWGISLDIVHTALDVAGMVPVIGEAADAVNAVIYLAEGDYVNAAISAAAIVPVLGSAATGGRLAAKAGGELVTRYGDDVGEAVLSYSDEAADAVGSAGSKADNLRSCNSFVAGTLVLMADGSTKPIQDVEVGDAVRATDPVTGEAGSRSVTHLIEGEGPKTLVTITIDGGTLVATDGHPFWVESEAKWIAAIDLEPGDELLTTDGAARIDAIGVERVVHYRVFNLTVDNVHTYYVLAGRHPVLSHNASPDDCKDTVYRVLRPDENPAVGLKPKNPEATYSVGGHVTNGSRIETQFISTTRSIDVAQEWAAKTGNRIAEIDLAKVSSPIFDLSTNAGRAKHIKYNNFRAINFASKSAEVLVQGNIPSSAIRRIF